MYLLQPLNIREFDFLKQNYKTLLVKKHNLKFIILIKLILFA